MAMKLMQNIYSDDKRLAKFRPNAGQITKLNYRMAAK